ncbi:MAG: valine--tRNA ligase, partial [Bacteroidales bacterium]|jgi:valyl-tRNA synthetase|nr:valine--tRNA ligase [Bacteroidales bacterium]
VRMVNWDPAAKTAVSDEVVIHKEEQSKLYYLNYKIEGEEGFVTIATTRPETILGDTAVCVNPEDERFQQLKGKRVIVPLVNRSIPIIEDDYVDMEFGTGCLKITPAHDIHDYEIGMKHHLEVIDIFNDNGTINGKAGLYEGHDRFEVRKEILPALEEAGSLLKIEDYTNKVGYSERTNVVIEPKLSAQWFLKMEHFAAEALENVENDNVEFHPKKFKNVYRHWMGNIKDWCISRQLWWGHRIPVYYLPDGTFVVADSDEKALELAQAKDTKLTAADLRQDEDVLDTWASSWLWPMSVFGGVTDPEGKEINYYYPTNDLVTGHDIIFFWVARMIMAGYHTRQERPFKNVYFTGMVRDQQGRKMSKSLGNSPDPLDLIAKYGADGVRVGILFCSPAGGDLLFDENLTAQGRNFTSKIWNSFLLVNGWEVSDTAAQPEASKIAIEWLEQRISQSQTVLNDHFEKFRISDALMEVYTLFRDEFSSWFLESVKPGFQQPIDKATYASTLELFEKLLKILHPFMPFISEEIYQLIKERADGDSIMIAQMPELVPIDEAFLNLFEETKDITAAVRNIRQEKSIPFKEALSLQVLGEADKIDQSAYSIITKLANVAQIDFVAETATTAASFMVKTTEYAVPLGDMINVEEEIAKLEKDLKYNEGFLKAVMAKLSNERFVNSAPEKVVTIERNKQADAESKIALLKEGIAKLKA